MKLTNDHSFPKAFVLVALILLGIVGGWQDILAGPMLSQVAIEPESLNVGSGDSARISFYLSETAAVILYIVDPDGWPIKTLLNGETVPAGRSVIQWNGTDDKGVMVPNEAYSVYIEAILGDERVRYNPGAESGGMSALVYPEIEQGSLPIRIRFELTEPLRVRVRVGIDRGPLLATPLDWQPLSVGAHEITWAGTSPHGALTPDLNQLKVLVDAYTLPRLVILTTGGAKDYAAYKYSRAQESGAWHELLQLGIGFEGRARTLGSHDHASRTRIVDQQPSFAITATSALNKASNRELAVTITVDELTAWVLPQSRFEVKLYINNELIIEEEQGIAPYTFTVPWNDRWGDDPLVTVNVATLNDQVGTMSRRMSNQ